MERNTDNPYIPDDMHVGVAHSNRPCRQCCFNDIAYPDTCRYCILKGAPTQYYVKLNTSTDEHTTDTREDTGKE